MARTAQSDSPVSYDVLLETVVRLRGLISEAGQNDFVFSSVAQMNAAIQAGTVPNGASCYVTEEFVNADTTQY